MASKQFAETDAFIRKYGQSVEKEIKTRLMNNGKVATGKLFKSIRHDVKETKEEFILSFYMDEYGYYVDKGSKPSKYADMDGKGTGKSEFIKSLMKWCQAKGLPKGLAFPIRRSIWKYGIAPTNFFTIPTTRRQKQFDEGVEKNMAKDIDNMIQKEIDAA